MFVVFMFQSVKRQLLAYFSHHFYKNLCRLVLLLIAIAVVLPLPAQAITKKDREAVVNDSTSYEECATDTALTTDTAESSVSGRAYILGDSIAAGTAADLDGTLQALGFTEVVVNAVASRSLSEGSTDLNGLSVLANDKAQYSSANAVIIELGTNGGVTAENIKKTVDIIKQSTTTAKIYWVNVGVDNTRRNPPPLDATGTNALIAQSAGLGYTVIDWATAIKQHPDYIDPNPDTGLGVHPAGAGIQGYAATVANTLAGTSLPQIATNSSNSCVCESPGSGSSSLVGTENQEKIFNFLIGKGLSPPQAAGLMGNMQAESGFNPGIVERSGGGGFGLSQWTGGRRTQLENAAKAKGVPVNDLAFQLQYLYDESNNRALDRSPPHPATVDTSLKEWVGLTTLTTVRDAAIFWHWYNERSADDAAKIERRVQFANDILTRFGSSSGANFASGGTTCITTTSGLVSGGFSLPTDRIFYDQHPEWFSKPHHDYPAADIPVPTNTPIYSVSGGKIISAPTAGSCGTGLEIDAGNGIRFVYCHGLDGGAVPGAKLGDQVQPGQLIMHSDSTGTVTGPHLHFAIKFNGKDLCPQSFLVGIATGQVPDISGLPSSGCSN